MRSISEIILLGTILRVFLFLDATGPGVLLKYTQSAALRSLLFHPKYTLEYVKETIFISKYGYEYDKSNPLLFVVAEKFIANTAGHFDHDLVFCIVSLLVDLAVVYQLYRLAKALGGTETEHQKWEKETEQNMSPLIYPISPASGTFLFGLRFEDKEENFSIIFAASNVPALCAFVYYLNPFTILTSASGTPSFQGFYALVLVSAVLQAVKGNALWSGMCLAILCHVDIFNVIFLMPSALLWKHRYEFKSSKLKSKRPTSLFFVISFLFWFVAVNFVSLVLRGWCWQNLIEVYNVTRDFQNLSPNLGVDWYLFMNTFMRCREYFVIICSGFIFLFCIPMLLRFYHYPMEMIIMLHLLRILFNPRPTLQDMSVSFALMTLARRSLARMGYASVISLLALPVPVILYVVDHWLWLQSGSGNANYMFFQCLAFNLFLGTISLDFISSTLKRDKALHLTSDKYAKKKNNRL